MKGGDLDLKLKKVTPHELPERRSIGRPKKDQCCPSTTMPVDQGEHILIPPTDIAIETHTGESIPVTEEEMRSLLVPQVVIPATILSANDPVSTVIRPWLQVLKRKRDEELVDEKIVKYIRAHFASALKAIEIEEEKDQERGPVLIPRSYEEAVNDLKF